MNTGSLLTETPGSELHATWEVLANAGIRRNHLKKIRNNPELAGQIAKILAVRERRTKYAYPPEYKPLSIVEQVSVLQKIPAFADLDATWALNEAQDWYNSLDLPEWIENPLVYIWHESVGGYKKALDLILEAIAKERNFCNYRKGLLTSKHLRQSEATRQAEMKLKANQPGDFLIVPSQAGDRWGGYPVKEVRESYDDGEFGLGTVAEGCRIISHPNRLVRLEELDIDCAGDEFDDPVSDIHFGSAPFFRLHDDRVEFITLHVVYASDGFGSASGFAPQS